MFAADDQPSNNTMGTIFGTCFALLSLIGFLANIVCVFHIIGSSKYKRSSFQSLMLNYFSIKSVYGIFTCFYLLMDSRIKGTYLYIKPSNAFCRLAFISEIFGETGEVFMLFLIWLILLSERKFVGFQTFCAKISYSYQIKQNIILKDEVMPASQSVSPSQPVGNRSKNFLMKVLFCFYVVNLLGSFGIGITGELTELSYYNKTYCTSPEAIGLLVLMIFSLVFLPVVYTIIICSSLLWNLFGGKQDPLINKLTTSEATFIKLLKILSLLKGVEMFFMDMRSSVSFFLPEMVVELARVLSLVLSILSAVIFIYFEMFTANQS